MNCCVLPACDGKSSAPCFLRTVKKRKEKKARRSVLNRFKIGFHKAIHLKPCEETCSDSDNCARWGFLGPRYSRRKRVSLVTRKSSRFPASRKYRPKAAPIRRRTSTSFRFPPFS